MFDKHLNIGAKTTIIGLRIDWVCVVVCDHVEADDTIPYT